MKILNKIIEFVKTLIIKLRKLVHVEVTVNSEKVEEKLDENVAKPAKPAKPVEKTEKTDKQVEVVKTVKRRGRPRKVKAE